MRCSFLVLVACVVTLSACGSKKDASAGPGAGGASADGGPDGSSGSGGSSGSAGAPNVPGPICFLTNCSSDAECKDCSFGRTQCDVASQRCVACDASSGQGCPSGQVCTKYGTCASSSATCPDDGSGNPTVTCASDGDCAACDPQHQICNTATKSCVACSSTDTSACSGNQHCGSDGACVLNCPDNCTADADCAECGTSSAPAHACNESTHQCGQCSATSPCPGGKACSPNGVCVNSCGVPDKPAGTCTTDDDCKGCGADAIACHVPINGGDGRCGLPASGCSDIGNGVTALPAPWSSVTNTCSNDSDCSGVGLDLNVGKMLRDLTGLSSINDATLQYGMHSCASISIGLPGGTEKSCGLCVPCKTDSDCSAIQVDPLVDQAFGGLGKVAAKWALDKLYGDKPHVINMYCQSVAGSYGVCAPCGDPSSACGVATTVGSGCTNVWECAAGEYCNNGKCQPDAPDCWGGSYTCPSGTICAWNGDRHCCRVPGTGTSSCGSDAECSPQICSEDANGKYVCMDIASTCT